MTKEKVNQAILDTVDILSEMYNALIKDEWVPNTAAEITKQMKHLIFLKLCEEKNAQN